MTEYTCAVNIMNDYRYGTLYIGVTNNAFLNISEKQTEASLNNTD